MHTAQSMPGQGIGRAMLRRIIASARAAGLTRLSLETRSWPYFRPAQALYRTQGFADCPPFGDYSADPNGPFMTLALDRS